MKKRFLAFVLLGCLLCGCGRQEITPTFTDPTGAETEPAATQPQATLPSDTISDRDREGAFEETGSARIMLQGSTASCTSDAVKIQGSTVTITDEGTYILSGKLDNGMIVVNADKSDKTQLVFEGVSVHSQTSAAVYVLQADKVFITLAEGSENTLSNGGSFEAIDDNNIDAVVFSKEDLTVNGSGSLTVTSPAGHGVVSKDDLTVAGGTLHIECASHGLSGKDSVSVAGAFCNITAGKDGIHSENDEDAALGNVLIESGSFVIDAQGDGISAGAAMQILGGSFTITTGGGSANAQKQTSDSWGGFGGGKGGMGGGWPGMGGGFGGMGGFGDMGTTDGSGDDSTSIKGIKAGTDLQVLGGSFTIDSADDAVHSNGNITVSEGAFQIATGDDGFHADDTLTVTGGSIVITESYEGLEGLHINISGGDITLTASDDGLNAAGGTDQSGFGGHRGGDMFGGMGMGGSAGGSIEISGGKLSITASGDGIDANGTLAISGGYTTVCGPTQGDTATLDYDTSAVITGGTFIGTGASGMAQSFSENWQGLIAGRVSSQSAGTQITLSDSAGNVIMSHTPALSYGVVILSSPSIVTGESYTLTIGTESYTVKAE